jgi:outer membrane protein OmpA-like peptidoglycan-associated protein
MTGLMMIFMLVAIMFMLQLQAKEKEVKDLGRNFSDLRAQLCTDLQTAFKDQLQSWQADVSCSLTVRFLNPDIQFDTSKADVKDRFQSILKEFFPKYVAILMSDKYRNSIEEVRIEGHTSQFWAGKRDEQSYYKNMALSQERSRAVLAYVFSIPQIREYGVLQWLVPLVTANGLSYTRPIINADGTVDDQRSQRVEFRVRLRSEDRLAKILEALAK